MSLHPSLLALGPLGTPELIIIFVMGAVLVLPVWFICKKAGLPPRLALIMLVPLGAIVLPFILAFTEWPSLKRSTSQQE